MATLVLSTVGTLIGGPVGAAIGGLLGNVVDARLFASGSRSGPRLSDLSVQSSAYGVPIARCYGRVRVAGSVIWSNGLKERRRKSGGKASGGSTTTYSYSASFAVLLSARTVQQVGRIWADGKLLRNADGQLMSGGDCRIRIGDERQSADPLIVAAEGADAPAMRGQCIAVFEDLELADFANRIPNLSFEVIADPDGARVCDIASDLAAQVGQRIGTRGLENRLDGFAAGRDSSLRDYLQLLDIAAPFTARSDAEVVLVGDGQGQAFAPEPIELGSTSNPGERLARSERAHPTGRAPSALALAHVDPARDYQAGVQRAQRGDLAGGQEARIELPAVLTADAAKSLAASTLARRTRQRETLRLRLPYRFAALKPGDLVWAEGRTWLCTEARIEAMCVHLVLAPPAAGVVPLIADAGRPPPPPPVPQGATTLLIVELPSIGAAATSPQIVAVAAGEAAGWRLAAVEMSTDDGNNWSALGTAGRGAVFGRAMAMLPPASARLWDRHNSVDVELLSPEMTLTGQPASSVLGGQNLALLGGELLGFRFAEQIGPRQWRLTGLLRGRFGSEARAASHAVDEPFLLLDSQQLLAVPVALDSLGGTLQLRAFGPLDRPDDVPVMMVAATGWALKPLQPVHLRVAKSPVGGFAASWRRQDRGGFLWPDGGDVPLTEAQLRFRVEVAAGAARLQREVEASAFTLSAAERAAVFPAGPQPAVISVSQISSLAGAGPPAVHDFIL